VRTWESIQTSDHGSINDKNPDAKWTHGIPVLEVLKKKMKTITMHKATVLRSHSAPKTRDRDGRMMQIQSNLEAGVMDRSSKKLGRYRRWGCNVTSIPLRNRGE